MSHPRGLSVSFARWNLNSNQTAALVGVLLLTLLVYLRCLSNGFVSDDHREILMNRFIGQWSLLWRSLAHNSMWFSLGQRCYYRPLKNLWTALNFHLFGLHPAGWHALKILLHLGVVLIAFRVAQLLTGSASAALVTALLFGLLPVHTEVVAWISATPEPLAAAFELGALCGFIQRKPHSGWGYALPLTLFAGALLSFEGAITFPLLIMAYTLMFENTGPFASNPREHLLATFRRAMPFLVLALIYVAVRTAIVGLSGLPGVEISPTARVTFLQLLALLPSMIVGYIEIMLVPWIVGPAHQIRLMDGFGALRLYLGFASLIFIVAGSYLAIRTSSRRRLYLFCMLWWLLSLLPMLNVVTTVDPRLLPQVIQDRYLYLPSFGACLLAGDLISRAGRSHNPGRMLVAGLVTAISLLYATIVWNAQGFWHDSKAMLAREIELAPDTPIYHRNMALLLDEQGDLKEAENEEMMAVRLDPESAAERFFLSVVQQHLADRQAQQHLADEIRAKLTESQDGWGEPPQSDRAHGP